jgi:hypothetical protein
MITKNRYMRNEKRFACQGEAISDFQKFIENFRSTFKDGKVFIKKFGKTLMVTVEKPTSKGGKVIVSHSYYPIEKLSAPECLWYPDTLSVRKEADITERSYK